MFAIAPGLVLVQVVLTAIFFYVLYWVIRLGVRHALQDQARPAGEPNRAED